MGFLAPWFLAGLAAIGLPVYIHLLRKQTTVPRPVSSLMFFEQGTQSSTKHRRLRYLVLFALRTLLILLLVLAFANPFLRRSSASARDTLLLVAVDNSYSMNAGTRFVDARRGASDVLAGRRLSQRAQVLSLGGQLQVLTQPIQDSAALRAAVEAIQPGDAHGNFGELGRGIRAMAETVHTPIELHLFSDMQASNMPANFADMVMPANVTLVLHPVGETTLANWTVESVEAPSRLVDTKKARTLVVIAGHETPAGTRTVSLIVNGAVVATRKVDVPANGRATVAFDSLDVPYGTSRCEVRIDSADRFPADDASLFAVKRADPERVLFVHQASDTRSPLYFGAALAASAQTSFVLQPITPEQATDIDPSKYAFAVLSDLVSIPSILENSLLRNVENGGGVLIAAGASSSHHERIPVYGANVLEGHFYSRTGSFSTISQTDASHPSLHLSAAWPEVKFFYASAIDPLQARIAARLADSTPLLLDKQIGNGHVLVFASGFDNLTNDMPLHPVFVPFVEQTARYLSGVDRLSGARVVDSFVQLRDASAASSQVAKAGPGVDVVGPDGRHLLSLAEAATAQSFQLTRAGFYQIRFGNGREALIAANPDRREADLQPIPADVLKLWTGSSSTSPVSTGSNEAMLATEHISSLWWWVMLFLLVVALSESILASRYLGTQREEA